MISNKQKPEDYYKKICLKCGLEIHKRLDTKKLFCNCSTKMCGKSICSIKRKLNMSSGELGQLDEVAKKEIEKQKTFEYICFEEETCLVDIDEEPPHLMNKNALDIVLDLCLKFNCYIPDSIYVMRKIVLDGSNTTGFQRTALVGINGKIKPFSDKKKEIIIDSVCIEEESAQIQKDEPEKRTYLLNRLGIPLIEITTNTFFATPQELKEIALYIGMVLNSTEKTKRGIGTIRQDVNISIKEGARVEIKGLQDIRSIDKVIDLEIQRQQSLIELKKKLENKEIKFSEFFNATKFFSKTKSKIFAGKETYGFAIKNFAGLFCKKLNEKKALGSEISRIACIGTNSKGIIHTDENLEKYNIKDEFEEIRTHFKFNKDDLIICIATNEANAVKLFNQLKKRVLDLKKGVLRETRYCMQNNDTIYMRAIAGAKRMYPETDIPKIEISRQYLEKKKKNLFKTYEEIKKFYTEKLNLTNEFANQIINLKMNKLFLELIKTNIFKNKENEIAKLVISASGILEKIENKYNIEQAKNCFEECFTAKEKGKITKQAMYVFLGEKLKNPKKQASKIIKECNIEKLDKNKIIKIIKQAKNQLKQNNKKQIIKFIESKYKNKIDKKELIDCLIL